MKTTKQCPFCKEEILQEATKCKHCKELLTTVKRRRNRKKTILLGCGCFTVACVVLLLALIIFAAFLPEDSESGVRLFDNIPSYASEYIKKHKILNNSEEIIAYYDQTITQNGSLAYILTAERIISHKRGENSFFYLKNIVDITHRSGIIGEEIIEISINSGKTMKIEIDPLNGGETFYNVLNKTWNSAKEKK